MAPRKPPIVTDQLLEHLLAGADAKTAFEKNGLLDELKKALAERTTNADALLAKLAAGLAHEVRNPLAGLLNAVSTLRRFGDDPAIRRDTLDLVERGLRSIGRVADTMLATYRPAAGRMRFVRTDLDDLQLLVTPEARRRHVALDWRIDAMQPIAVDAEALRQALLNLLLNACNASGEGGRVALIVTQSAMETIFAIEDSGPGMPDSILAFLVDGAKTAPMTSHKGLGLWMVVRLLEDLEGRIKVESRSGEGTRVSIRLPVGPVPTVSTPTASPPPAGTDQTACTDRP
jgi:signal transduction histidine kinase